MENVRNSIWDPALRSGQGGWRAMTVADMGGGGSGGGGLTNTELRAKPVAVAPEMAAGGNQKVTLVADTAKVPVAQAAKQITIANPGDADLMVTIGGTAFPVFSRGYFTFFGMTNTNQLSLLSTSAGDVYIRWES